MEASKLASVPPILHALPPAPTFRDIAEEVVADHERENTARVNVFAECIKDGHATVSTESQASEIARMINRAESDLYAAELVAKAIVDRAQARLKNLEFLFMTPLAIWASAQLAGKKVRNMLLEGGKLSFRKVPKSVKTVDAAALLEWCQTNLPAAVELVPKVKTDVVKAWEEKDNEIAPGREVTPESDSFKVSIPASK